MKETNVVMVRSAHARQERIVEAVRQGLDGEAAVEFLHQNGYAMTSAGIARHLRAMGGRGNLVELIQAGKTNGEIMAIAFPGTSSSELPFAAPSQRDLFAEDTAPAAPLPFPKEDLFDTTKITLRIPTDLYTALRLAAKGEGTTQSQLITDLLTSALSRMPNLPDEDEDGGREEEDS